MKERLIMSEMQRQMSKSDERSRGESDFTILHDGHYLGKLVCCNTLLQTPRILSALFYI